MVEFGEESSGRPASPRSYGAGLFIQEPNHDLCFCRPLPRQPPPPLAWKAARLHNSHHAATRSPRRSFPHPMRVMLDELYAAGSDEDRQAIASCILEALKPAHEAPQPLTGTRPISRTS